MSSARRAILILFTGLALGCQAHALAPAAAPVDIPEKDDGWGDGLAPGTYDTCPAVHTSTSSTPLPERKVMPVACGDWCKAETVEIAGNAFSVAFGKSVLERVGLRVVGHDPRAPADVRIELAVDLASHGGGGGITCHPQLGCAGGPEPSWSTYEGGFSMFDHAGKLIATQGSEHVERGLVTALAEHRGGATFGLVRGSRAASPVGWQELAGLFHAKNDWTHDPAARALLPMLVDEERLSQSKGAEYLNLLDPNWGCAPEVAPKIDGLASAIRAGDYEAMRVASYIPDPRITAAYVAIATGPSGPNALLIRALRHRSGGDEALLAAAERVATGDDSLDLGLQLWLTLRAHADGAGDPATPLGALHFFGTQTQIGRALDALAASPDPRATYVLALPLMVGNSSREVETKAIGALAHRGAIGALVLAEWLSAYDVEQQRLRPYWEHPPPPRDLEAERAVVTAAIETSRSEPLVHLDRALAQLATFHALAPFVTTALETFVSRTRDPNVDRALEELYGRDTDPEFSWAMCIGVRRGIPSARTRAQGSSLLRRCT